MGHLLTRKEAEEATGKSRATFARDIKKGKLSVAEKNDQGHNLFDPSELERVYGRLKLPASGDAASEQPQSAAVIHSNEAVLQAEIETLKQRITDKDERIAEKDDQIADLRSDRNDWRRQAQNLLPKPEADQAKDQEQEPASKKEGWLRRLTGF